MRPVSRPTRVLGQRWLWCRAAFAALATTAFALAIGVPTGVVPTPLYTRMTPVLWWNYPIWAVTAVLGGLVSATYVRGAQDTRTGNGVGVASGGGLLAAFAVGCPVCNKLVVAVVGLSGALNLWAPLQPVLAVFSVLLLAWALRLRLRGARACSVPAPVGTTPVPPARASVTAGVDPEPASATRRATE